MSSDGVLIVTVKGFDSEVLLDPFEKTDRGRRMSVY
jgi:hypothetical protein